MGLTRGGQDSSIKKLAKTRAKNASGASGRPQVAATIRQDNIGKALRSVYDETLTEHIPDSMLDLLRKLD